jgi:hypothetical protein
MARREASASFSPHDTARIDRLLNKRRLSPTDAPIPGLPGTELDRARGKLIKELVLLALDAEGV